jgi:hypothetical protein
MLRSKAQWDKTKPKSRRQCHACGEREGEGQNYSYLHGNLSDEKLCHRDLQRYPSQAWNDAPRTGEKLCPKSRSRSLKQGAEIGGEMELFPAH